MKKHVIFDLDQTLIDTSVAAFARKNRNWQQVYSLIPSFVLYNGIADVFKYIRNEGIRVCIVTNSPGSYAKKVLQHHNIPYDHLVDYFSVSLRKPNPEAIFKAKSLLECDCESLVSFGDSPIDIEASKRSGVTSVACFWGTDQRELLLESNPDFSIYSPIEMIDLFRKNSVML